MSHFLIVVLLSGFASQYSRSTFERVIANRQKWGQLVDAPKTDGYVAVEDCRRVGEVLYLRPVGGEWERFLIADCAGGEATRQWMRRNRIVVEVDTETAKRWGFPEMRGIPVEAGKRIVEKWRAE